MSADAVGQNQDAHGTSAAACRPHAGGSAHACDLGELLFRAEAAAQPRPLIGNRKIELVPEPIWDADLLGFVPLVRARISSHNFVTFFSRLFLLPDTHPILVVQRTGCQLVMLLAKWALRLCAAFATIMVFQPIQYVGHQTCPGRSMFRKIPGILLPAVTAV